MFGNKAYRAAQKFKLKYGFDSHLFADGKCLALNDEQLAEFLGVPIEVLNRFYGRRK